MGKDSKPQLLESEQRFQFGLESGDFTMEGRFRQFFKWLPAEPRSRLFHAPYEGFGDSIKKRAFNKYPSNYKPQVRNTCFDVVRKEQIGA